MVLVQFKDQNPAKFARQEVVRTSLGRLLTSPRYSQVLVQFKDQNPVKFARQEVVRTSLGRLLTSPSYSQVLVPVFQRPYCWPRNQLQPW